MGLYVLLSVGLGELHTHNTTHMLARAQHIPASTAHHRARTVQESTRLTREPRRASRLTRNTGTPGENEMKKVLGKTLRTAQTNLSPPSLQQQLPGTETKRTKTPHNPPPRPQHAGVSVSVSPCEARRGLEATPWSLELVNSDAVDRSPGQLAGSARRCTGRSRRASRARHTAWPLAARRRSQPGGTLRPSLRRGVPPQARANSPCRPSSRYPAASGAASACLARRGSQTPHQRRSSGRRARCARPWPAEAPA